MTTLRAALIAATILVGYVSPSHALVVPDGTVTSSVLFTPTINLSTNPNSYSAMNGGTIEIAGTGGFANVTGTLGTLNGTLLFSNVVGGIVPEVLTNFFVFSDNAGGNYSFSTISARTDALNTATSRSSGTLFVLGTTVDSNLNYNDPTPTSLTIQFNSTGGSQFSSALTLAIPPADTSVPEPASLALLGMGLLGAGLIQRRRNA